MNKRQRKKKAKKEEMFIASFVSSYRELKELDRSYHEYMVDQKRKEKLGRNKDKEMWWLDDFM